MHGGPAPITEGDFIEPDSSGCESHALPHHAENHQPQASQDSGGSSQALPDREAQERKGRGGGNRPMRVPMRMGVMVMAM